MGSSYSMDSRMRISKKYPNMTCREIFKIDPDYLLFFKNSQSAQIKFVGELKEKLENFEKVKKSRGVTKVSRFKIIPKK